MEEGGSGLRYKITALVLAGAFLLAAEPARAQDEDHFDFNNAIGVGVGLTRVEGFGVLSVTGTYRFNWWDDEDESLRQTLTGGRSRIKGFVEAEVGYWKESDLRPFDSDFTVGVNAIAVYPTRHVDIFFGGGVGAHFLSESASVEAEESQGNQTKFGTNIQFGVDLNFTEPVAIFALGRYDILQGDIFDFQSKIQVGLRYRF